MGDPRCLLVLAPNWLGDAVMALPAIADVRRRYDSARLVVAARTSISRLFTLVPAVDEIVNLEWRGRAASAGTFWRDASRLRAVRADMVIVLPNSFAAALLAWRAGARDRWGYAADARRLLLSRAVARPGTSMHQAAYYQHLTTALGVPPGPRDPCVVVPTGVREQARDLLRRAGHDPRRPLVVLAPGAAYGTAKRWWPQHFAQLAADLVSQCGAHGVLVGSAADAATCDEVLAALSATRRQDVTNLCGRTSLDLLAGVFASAHACVSNDSGAMHLAAAVGVPLAAIFGPTNEHETAPLSCQGAPVRLLINPVACRPCMLRECPIDHPCMRDLTPARVFTTVAGLLREARLGQSSVDDTRGEV